MGFGGFGALFFLVFVLVIGIFVVTAARGFATWNQNNNSPRLDVTAKIVSKRKDISSHHHANAGDMTGTHGYSSTTAAHYYVTFQVESGDQMEFSVNGSQYGILTEGESGELSFQGTRYLSFEPR